jgi:hypothetical protein
LRIPSRLLEGRLSSQIRPRTIALRKKEFILITPYSRPIHVLAFNEPDQCGGGGACMIDIGRTVAAFKTWMQPLQNYGDRMKIGSPAVTNGDKGSGGNIMGLAFLKQFVNACSGCQIDFVTIHW